MGVVISASNSYHHSELLQNSSLMCWPTLVFQLSVLLHCVEEGHISRITTHRAELKARSLDAHVTGMPSTAWASMERRGCVRVFVCVRVCVIERQREWQKDGKEMKIGILHKLNIFCGCIWSQDLGLVNALSWNKNYQIHFSSGNFRSKWQHDMYWTAQYTVVWTFRFQLGLKSV